MSDWHRIPVRYEMRGYNTLLGSHYDHYHLDYDSYKHDDIPDDIFEVDQGKSCSLSVLKDDSSSSLRFLPFFQMSKSTLFFNMSHRQAMHWLSGTG